MEQETLFTASKWDILKVLSTEKKSPIQLAKVLNTSVANVSQQLRLLEMAGLVQSKRISNRDKGQPRLLYSLSGNHSFLIASANDFVEKKFLQLSEYNKIILKIWFLDNPEAHYFLEKAFWHVEEHIEKINAIFIDRELSGNITMILESGDDSLKKILKKIDITNKAGLLKTINFEIKSEKEIKTLLDKKADQLYVLYDPSEITDNKDNK